MTPRGVEDLDAFHDYHSGLRPRGKSESWTSSFYTEAKKLPTGALIRSSAHATCNAVMGVELGMDAPDRHEKGVKTLLPGTDEAVPPGVPAGGCYLEHLAEQPDGPLPRRESMKRKVSAPPGRRVQ